MKRLLFLVLAVFTLMAVVSTSLRAEDEGCDCGTDSETGECLPCEDGE